MPVHAFCTLGMQNGADVIHPGRAVSFKQENIIHGMSEAITGNEKSMILTQKFFPADQHNLNQYVD